MKNAIISKLGQKRILALVLTLALMLSTVFVPAVATTTAIAQIPYIPSDADFSAPAVNCTVNGDKYDAVVTWNAVSGADSYTVTVYAPDGTVAGTATTADTTATIAAIADYATTTDVYTVQVAAKIGDTTVAASMIARFVPFANVAVINTEPKNASRWNLTPNDNVTDVSTDGKCASIQITDASEQAEVKYPHIPVAADAQYLFFWIGSEIIDNTAKQIRVRVNITAADCSGTQYNMGNSPSAEFISASTGSVTSEDFNHSFVTVGFDPEYSMSYIVVPLSKFDETFVASVKEAGECGFAMQVLKNSFITYDVNDPENTEKQDLVVDRPIYIDNIGTTSDLVSYKNMLADSKIAEKSFGYSVEPEYEISDTSFKAPAVSCVKNSTSGKLDATVTWAAVNGADDYKVNLYKSNGVLISTNSATTTATVSGLSSAVSADDIYTVQIVAYKGDTALCASVVEQFVPYDESNATLRDYNGTETDVNIEGKAPGTHSPDGTSISTKPSFGKRTFKFSNIEIRSDAEYFIFWIGAEMKDTWQYSDHQVTFYPDNGSDPAARTSAWQSYAINSNTGECFTKNRNATDKNTSLMEYFKTRANSDYYIAVPLSAYDVTDPETGYVTNPVKGKTCMVSIYCKDCRTRYVADGTEKSQKMEEITHFDSLGSVKNIDTFIADMSKMHANYKLDDITVTASELPFNATNPGFAAPTFKNTLTDDGISTEFAWVMFPNAATYQLKVYNSMLNEVASIDTANLNATVEGLVEKLHYTVQVTALDINGKVLGASAYRKFIAYDNAKYYNIGNDMSGDDIIEWSNKNGGGGGKMSYSPDGAGYWANHSGGAIDYNIADVEIPTDAEAFVIWVGQEDLGDGTRIMPDYRLRYWDEDANDYVADNSGSGLKTNIYYLPTDGGDICTNQRPGTNEKYFNTWYFPSSIKDGFGGIGYIVVPFSIYNQEDIAALRGTTTKVKIVMKSFNKYDENGDKVGTCTADRDFYMDNIGTISDVDAFVNEFDAFNATYNSEVGYYNTTDTTAVFTATGTNCGTLSLVAEGMKYSVDGGENWIDVTGSTVNVTGVTAENGIQVYLPAGDIVDTATEVQVIDITQPAAPTGVTGVQCTTSAVADGMITGVTADMEYTSNGVDWTTVNGTEITGLASGTYYVRYKANGTALASVETNVFVDPVYRYNAEDLKDVRKCLLIKDYKYAYADVNGDGVVNILDLIRLKKVLAGDYTD